MSVFINPKTIWTGPGPNYQDINRLCHDLDEVFDEFGIDGCVCFENEMIRAGMLEYIEQSDHEVYLVICTEQNAIDKKSSTGEMRSWYIKDRGYLDELASRKTIILASAQNNDHLDGPEMNHTIRMRILGAAMLVDYQQYRQITPALIKDFSSTYHWISLNHGSHHHRIMMAMTLLGHDLGMTEPVEDRNGLLHISPGPVINLSSWKDYCDKNLLSIPQEIDIYLQKGFDRLRDILHSGQPDGDYLNRNYCIENPKNFDQCLRHLYSNSVIEIINDTTYYNSAGTTHNEKYVNAIMGMNIPLVLSNVGAVQELRELGFDVFDDIIDHSYDAVQDPIQRMVGLVESNLEILRNQDLARMCWVKSLPRLIKNIDHYRGLYDQIKDAAEHDLRNLLKEL